ncbi:MAG: hypothetical protein AMJ75_02230 [Phycisphaerae bacterium SM1_79]|nr:MAG: hypothetical protein AMJ75_02230 [Phycisphaerae bacterium SM1_79]
MATINSLLSDLDERVIARRVATKHDEVRMRYHLRSNTVTDFGQFKTIIADYGNYHYTSCVSHGGTLTSSGAYGRVKAIIENEYRRRRGNIVSAFNDAHDGTNGGLRAILDIICEGIKAEAVEHYIQDAFDCHVAPNSWDQKVDIIRQFILYNGNVLSSSVVASQPERYAHDYSELIRAYVEGLRQTSAMFRRL